MPDPTSQPEDGAAHDPLIGRTLANKFRLEKLLGQGGMGAVYRARQLALEKTIAVKIMHAELASDPMFAARFHREAKAASQLDHPNSIGILDFGEEPDGILYIAMEFLDGRDLLAIVEAEAPLAAERIVDILTQALSALAVAHDLGIIHRDLKPENIMILRRKGEDDRLHDVVKVCDFGIAKVADGVDAEEAAPARAKKGKLTTAGLVIGTPEYMSPEQGRGEPLDARCDLYSTGVILYLLLSGQTPFDAPTPLGIVLKHQSDEPLPPSRLRPQVDLRLEAICLKAMSKRPADRFANAREMRAALRAVVDPASSTATGPSSAGGAPRAANTEVTVHPQTRVVPYGQPSASAVAETAIFSSADVVAQGGVARATTAALMQAGPPPPRPRTALKIGAAIVALGALGGGGLLARSWLGSHDAGRPTVRRATPTPSTPAPARPLPQAPSPPSLSAPSRNENFAPASPNQPPVMKHDKSGHLGVAPLSAGPKAALGEVVPSAPVAAATPDPAPPPVAALPSPPPSPQALPAAPVAPLPAFDPTTVRVGAAQPSVQSGGVNPRAVSAVVNTSKITACFQRSATASSPEGTFALHVTTDDEGIVIEGRLDGPFPDAMKQCVARTVLGSSVRATDTGGVSATVPLTFRLR